MDSIPHLITGHGPALTFLHANGYPPGCYRPLFAHLAEHYAVRAMIQRPLWEGSKPEEIDDWTPLANDLLRYLDETHQTTPALVAGHSLGGIVTLRAALREPQRFKAIVLLDPVLFTPRTIFAANIVRRLNLGHKTHPLISNALNRRREFDDLERLFKSYRRKSLFKYMDDEALRAYIEGITCPSESGGYRLCYTVDWEVQIYHTGIWRDMELWHGLKNLKVPMLIIRGAETDTFLANAARRVTRINPDIKIETLEKSTHLVPLERPQEVSQQIHNFLATSKLAN
jgi:pimeloyl-ACP methyl ester carboxylesterase